MKTGALAWRMGGSSDDLANPWTALMWGEKFLHMSDGMSDMGGVPWRMFISMGTARETCAPASRSSRPIAT